jgi:hypothetical protein
MSFLDILDEAAEIAEVNYLKFLQQYKFQGKTIHLFFEGNDDLSFYMNFIQNTYPNDFTFYYYNCQGKGNVLQNYNDINWTTYNKNRGLFFTDKDLDDLLAINNPIDENIFETQYYSIENYIVNKEVFKRFLREICSIKNEDIINELEKKFEEELKVFHELITTVMAYAIFCRKNNLDLRLKDIELSNLFKVKPDLTISQAVNKTYTSKFDYISKATKTSYKTNFRQLLSISKQLKRIEEPKIFVRGKYELWFFFSFCRQTITQVVPKINQKIKERNKATGERTSKCNVHIDLKEQNILQIVAPRVKMPEDVALFLKCNLEKLTA